MLVPPEPERGRESLESTVDDRALIAGLKARDTTLSGAFYERVRPVVDRVLVRLLGARDYEYEDVAQRTLYELVNSIDRFRGDCPLDAWISVVAARMIFGIIRRRRRERRIFSDDELPETVPAAGSVAGLVAARRAVGRLRGELERMNQDRAWAFLLHDVYGYDLREIGQITGVSLSAAQSRLVRGRRDIHERVENDAELAQFFRHPQGDE